MINDVTFGCGRANESEIISHLKACEAGFVLSLNKRIGIPRYAEKLASKAHCFEAWVSDCLIGLVAVYCNNEDMVAAFVTNVSVLDGWQGRGIASHLVINAIGYVRDLGFRRLDLEVDSQNRSAISLYSKLGFIPFDQRNNMLRMTIKLVK